VVSPTTVTLMVLLLSPAAKLTVPVVAPLKSLAAVVPLNRVQVMDEVPDRSPVRVTVKFMVWLASLSTMDESAMLMPVSSVSTVRVLVARFWVLVMLGEALVSTSS
jgi:hypothetical protein